MQEKEIIAIYHQVLMLLKERRMYDAFTKLNLLLKELQDWQAINKKEELETIYQHMLQYATQGVDDPQQNLIFDHLLENYYDLANEIKEALLTKISSRLEYTQRRYAQIRPVQVLSLATHLELGASHRSLGKLLSSELNDQGEKSRQFELEHEQNLLNLFNHIWFSDRCENDELEIIKQLLRSTDISDTDRCIMVSGITLSQLRAFYPNKLTLLFELSDHSSIEVRQRVLVGIILIMNRHSDRIQINTNLMNQFITLCDNAHFRNEMESIIMQLVRTSETESITKRIRDEIMPEVIRMAPKIQDKIDTNTMKIEDLDDKNPEWQELLEESGIADKLQEFGELQMDGADVYISTFSALKSFAFFNHTMNWLMPFDTNHSTISNLFQDKKNLFNAMMRSPFLCNSDKYSFCLSLQQMPTAQQNMMTNRFSEESEQMQEIIDDDTLTKPNTPTKAIANQYIQDLYRLYTLNPHKQALNNPLQELLSFYRTPFFRLLFPTSETRQQLAEFYFSKNLYLDAIELFQSLQKEQQTAERFQKIGYCYQQTDNITQAIEVYEQADLLLPDNRWTMRRLAFCLRKNGNYKQALYYYLKCQKTMSENVNLILQIGHCYAELKQYDDAIASYFKADYLSPDTPLIISSIAWCYLLAQKPQQACKQYEKLLKLSTNYLDIMNAGHAFWINENQAKAMSLYEESLSLSPSEEAFFSAFLKDKPHLINLGISEALFSLWYDALHYHT